MYSNWSSAQREQISSAVDTLGDVTSQEDITCLEVGVRPGLREHEGGFRFNLTQGSVPSLPADSSNATRRFVI
jgi:hypothetical protein